MKRSIIESKYILELTEKEAETLDMVLCDYENEGENHTKKEYIERLNPFVDILRNWLSKP